VDNPGKEFIRRNALYEQLERLGIDRVKSELNKERPRIGTVGGPAIEKDWAWEWLRTKEAQVAAATASSSMASALLDEINKLLIEVPKTIHDSNVAAWWGKAQNVIEGWNPSKSAEGKSAAELFSSNLESIGKGASERRRGQHEMIALLNQAKQDLELRTTLVKTINAEPAKSSRKVFIVHGHDDGVREAVARFLERVGLEPIILHEQPSRGRTVIEKFEAHRDVGFAVVLLTPDDEGCERGGKPRPRARQNVVLELGYFVGVLGRDRVCALRRGDVEIPSDFAGVVYVPFDGSDGWKQALGKELEGAGFTIDWSKAMGAR
jgi:predicted nucleotide-binding protein